MGNLQASPSSSTTNPEEKFDVFINFRGKDIRDSFANTLREALLEKHIKTFMDDQLPKGERILQLFKRIEESKISIVIFSEDYGSSKWCLGELVKIMERKKINKQTVIPVFYGVRPSDVRKDSFVKGKFPSVLVGLVALGVLLGFLLCCKASLPPGFLLCCKASLSLCFCSLIILCLFKKKKKEDFPEEVQKWKEALIDASRLEGWESSVTRPDTILINAIVDDICKRLTGDNNISSPSDFKGLIGIGERIKQVKSLLCLNETDVRRLGIWGMGGIGKSSLAEEIFKQISGHQFEGACLIKNVREKLEESGGLDRLQNDILSKVLNDKKLELDDPTVIPSIIKKRLSQTKVLIVLDDVKDFMPLEELARRVDGLGQGSRIIITSRDKQELRNCGVDDPNIYRVKEFNRHEALQLFCNYAFKQNHPTEDLKMQSNFIVNYAKGNPLALKVLGSSLNQKSKKVWESAVNKLRTNVDKKILEVLKLSYDGLNALEQEVFLDIACFLKGKSRDYVATILDDCDSSLSVLIDKSLITVSTHGLIELHELLQDLGTGIVDKETPERTGEHSRLWRHKDVLDALKHGDGTNAVQGIFLNMFKIKKDIHLSVEAFNKMCNLRLLKFYNYNERDTLTFNKVQFREVLKNATFDKLRSFIWFGYPFPALPSNFNLENLVELDLSNSSKLKRLWEDNEPAPKLKWLRLNDCPHLVEIPDLSGSPLLGPIGVQNCRSLRYFPLLAPCVRCLRGWIPQGLTSLRSFPSTIVLHYQCHESLDLSSCISLTTFPQISGNLSRLNLSGTAIDEVPSSIENLIKLSYLNLSKCTRLKQISTNICKLNSLMQLNLENCSQLESFPEILDKMERLKFLYLSGTSIKELPRAIEHLTNLSGLYLNNCNKLLSLTELPSALKHLSASGCKQLQSIPDASEFANFVDAEFIFTNCLNLEETAVSNMLTTLKKGYEEGDEIGELTFFCPGSKVPEWFMYRTEGSSTVECCELKFQMPWHDGSNGRPLLGFVVCAHIVFEEYCGIKGDLKHLCIAYKYTCGDWDESSPNNITVASRNSGSYISVGFRNETLIDSDHIAFRFFKISVPWRRVSDFSNWSLELWLPGEKNSNCRIKSFGVCPIYAMPSTI